MYLVIFVQSGKFIGLLFVFVSFMTGLIFFIMLVFYINDILGNG